MSGKRLIQLSALGLVLTGVLFVLTSAGGPKTAMTLYKTPT